MDKIKKIFCGNCLKETECRYEEKIKKEVIYNIEIEYLEKYYVCLECGQKDYDDLLDYNTREVNKRIREKTDLITIEEIAEIKDKYGIGKKPLSLVLGFGEVTIIRYLDGMNPSKENSDLLKNIKNNPFHFEMILLNNREKITEIAFKKALGKTKQLELTNEHSKLYQIALYILKNFTDTTPLALQKILYFIKGFSKKFLKETLFKENAEAWTNGPVYRDIYDSFSYYRYNRIDYDEILKDYDYELTEEEKNYLDNITSLFACFSGNVLREMSHLTEPWIDARKGLEVSELSNRVIEEEEIEAYFKKVCESYEIKDYKDIFKYTNDLLHNALEKINNR